MAIYHFSAKVFQRSAGRSAVAAAAYRAGARLFDEQLGRTFNYSAKPGVVHSEILLPQGAPARWRDRAALWNEVEAAERRKDAQIAREIELALPRELPPAEAIQLARDFVRAQFVARGMVADLNVHWGTGADGAAQPHAHVMLSLRDISGEGFGKKQRAWNDRGLLRTWREDWAALVNARLAEAGHDIRIDHRSNAAQGIELEPQNKIGPAGARRALRGEDAERAAEHLAIARRNGARILADPELALAALTREQSTFTRRDLARFVNTHTADAAQFDAAMAKVEASVELVRVGKDGRGRDRFSTKEMITLERGMVASAVALDAHPAHPVDLARRQAAPAAAGLGEEQALAFFHVTRARDLAIVCGIAGGGKSTLFAAAREVWAGEGYRVRGAALSGIAAEGLEQSTGIESRTLASLEYAWAQGKELLAANDILVVDEAGMLGSRQLGRLVETVRAAGAKLVLVGDPEQLQAIEAGAALRAVAERVGVAEISEPRRQKRDWQKEATKELASGRTAAALARYEAASMTHRHETLEDAEAALVAQWAATRRQAPHQSRIILTHTRASARALNDLARAARRAAGELGPDRVLDTAQGARAFAEGERIYFLKNDRGLGVKNGTLGTLERIDGARLTVRLDGAAAGAGRTIQFDLGAYAEINHGYAATIHKSQGATVDVAHILATRGMDRHLAYVALSRHRSGVHLHWSADEFGTSDQLAARLGRERAKDTSLDYGLDRDASSDEASLAAYAEHRGLTPAPSAAEAPVTRPNSSWLSASPGLSFTQALNAAMRAQRPAVASAFVVGEPGNSMTERFARYEARKEQERRVAAARAAGREPLLPAIREPGERDSLGRGLAPEEIATAIARDPDVGRLYCEFRLHLEWAYRDPTAALARLEAIERAEGAYGAQLLLEAKGPKALGRLCGGAGLLASAEGRWLRAEAMKHAGEIGSALASLRAAEAQAGPRYRLDVEAQQRRDRIEVPALSEAARKAVFALRLAVAHYKLREGATPETLSRPELRLAGQISAAWSAARADANIAAELDLFEARVLARFVDGERGVTAMTSAQRDAAERRIFNAAANAFLSEPGSGAAIGAWSDASVIASARGWAETHQAALAWKRRQEEAERLKNDPGRQKLEATRARLLQERMSQWQDNAHRDWRPQESRETTEARKARGEAAKARMKEDIAALPAAELRKVEARWKREEQMRELEQDLRPSPRPRSPSPGM